jgi:hypothetical protein
MNVSFEEIGRLAVTFAAEGELGAGQVCMVSQNGTVAACAADGAFCGVTEGVRNGFAAVQVAGFAAVRCAEDVAVGYVNLCADGNGGVKAGGENKYLVVSVGNGTAVIKL